ncbi:hypothetical protein HGRIS_001342 [Hohenbuehelia grisea]|uniref:Uncharacterized protein n=1 Tax=Hohenbuehelia grisea TaxID=104357 RepID=A0ABR3JQ29_9AGAR
MGNPLRSTLRLAPEPACTQESAARTTVIPVSDTDDLSTVEARREHMTEEEFIDNIMTMGLYLNMPGEDFAFETVIVHEDDSSQATFPEFRRPITLLPNIDNADVTMLLTGIADEDRTDTRPNSPTEAPSAL